MVVLDRIRKRVLDEEGVVARFGVRPEAIPDDAADWDVSVRGAARLAESLSTRRREAYLYRNLSVLRTNVPIPDLPEHLEWGGAHRAQLEHLAAYLDEPEILERVPAFRDGT